MMEGRQDSELELAANAKGTVELPVTVKYQQLWSGLRQVVEKKEAGYVLEAGLAFDVPVIGRVRIPVRREGNLPLLRMPKIRLEKVAVAGLSARSADLDLAVAVDNPNDLDADLQGIDTALRFNERSVGRLVHQGTVHLPANGTQRLTVPLRLDLVQLGSAVFSLLSSGGVVDYGLDGNLSLTSAEPAFVPAEVPFSASGRAELSSGASGTR
jgi:LEA14-like dessication related protein